MKGTDRAILLALPVVALLAGFYFMVLAPKRESASKLGTEIATLQTELDDQKQVVAFSEQARKDFPKYYSRVVVLGKAVPAQADTASMLVQLDTISDRSKVNFLGIELGAAGGGAAEPAPASPPPGEEPPAAEEDPAEAGDEGSGENVPAGGAPTVSDAPTPATEATAATLPIGATLGPAGLATLPYKLTFRGSFFDVAGFFSRVDELVSFGKGSGQVAVDGRLLTIDGFSLVGGEPGSSPELDASFALTSYVTPPDQGAALGATPQGPAPAPSPAQPPTTPTSTVTP